MSERPTFSPFWHRVRAMTPRLRPQVQITRQFYRGHRWHVVQDPASNQFFRLSPVAYEFVGALDGRATVEDVWQRSLSRHGDDAPTQNEIIQLLSQLYNGNLLAVDRTPEVEQLLGRGRERLRKKVISQAIGLMYFRIRLFNPDRILRWMEPILRPLLNRWGLLAWSVLVISALAALIPRWEALRTGFDSAVAPANWFWLGAVFVCIKLIHEAGHGVICRRFGGQVPEFGVMMLVLVPAPYVDASACWAFPSKWKRIAVGAGGMIFELAVASLAAFVWIGTPQGSLLHQVSYNAMLTASVATVLFNANPLMRFDGYYILSDLLEAPNLMQRSQQTLKYLAQKYLYRIREATPPTNDPREFRTLVVYGALSGAYRVFLFISITLYLTGKLFALGVILAAWTAAAWFIIPLGAWVHWHATEARIADRRGRAALTSVALVLLGLVMVGVVPMPDRRRAVGVVEGIERSSLFFGAEGFVVEAHVRPGYTVRAGDPLVTCESPQLLSELKATEGAVAEAEAVERRATASNAAAAQVARRRVVTLTQQAAMLREKANKLVIRAPHDGVIVAGDPAMRVGALVKEGDPVCEIVDLSSARVRATLDQTEASWIFELPREAFSVEMRRVTRPGDVLRGRAVHIVDAGQRRLPHAALGFKGEGSVETEARDEHGVITARPQFDVRVEPDRPDLLLAGTGAGERVKLRFSLPHRPWGAQWLDRLRKIVQGRIDI